MTDVAVIESKYQALANPIEGVLEAIKENLGNKPISEFDLTKVTVPTGAGLRWEVPTLDGSQSMTEIRGVVVAFKDVRAYWPGAYGGGGAPPDCSSQDSIIGIGNPGGVCATCPLGDFGGPCKEHRLIFLLQTTGILPLILSIPRTSIKQAVKYFVGLAGETLPFWTVESVFRLEKTKSKDGIDYSRVVFTKGDRLSEVEKARSEQAKKYFSTRLVDVGAYASE